MAKRVSLVGGSGRSLDLESTIQVGRDLLAEVVGDEKRLVSAVQFRVVRGDAGWLVAHEPQARNPTYYQGAPLGAAPVRLENGSVISIGRENCKLNVRFEYS